MAALDPRVDILIDGNDNIAAGRDVNIYHQSGELRSAADLVVELRARSRKYRVELTGTNGPYRHLNIAEAILAGLDDQNPGSSPATRPLLEPVFKGEDNQVLGLEASLKRLWLQSTRHALLLGEGGMGKTVTLLHLWRTLLESEDQRILPLFIALHEYNSIRETERDHFLAARIAWHYLGQRVSDSAMLNELWRVFTAAPEQDVPTVVLLLDGFNEVTVENRPLLLELHELRQKGRAVQLVLTSRYVMNFSWAEGFHTIVLQPLSSERIHAYLHAYQVADPSEKRLQEVLQNPMMLTLYASSNAIVEQCIGNARFDFTARTTTQGELLWNYLEAQLVKLDHIYGSDTYEYHYYKFVLRHFLPYLGYIMEREGQYSFAAKDFTNLINTACAVFLSKEFILSYPEFRQWLRRLDLGNKDFPDDEERAARFRKTLCETLSILRDADEIITFQHQNFRDVFAALHLLQELKQSAQVNQVPAALHQRALPVYVRRYMGEISGETYQTDAIEVRATVLSSSLEYLRGKFQEAEVSFAVWNLVSIWKDTRPHLAGLNFSNLNLIGSEFNGAVCYQRVNGRYISSSFERSLVTDNCFLPQGHADGIQTVIVSRDGDTVFSCSADRTIKLWEVVTGRCLATFSGHDDRVTSVAFSPDGHTIVSASWDHTLKLWEVVTGRCLATFTGHDGKVTSVAFGPDGQTVVSGSEDRTIKVWEVVTGRCLSTLIGHEERVTSVAFSQDERVISGSVDHTLKLWDPVTKQCINTFAGHGDRVTSVAFSPDGRTVLSGSWDRTVKLWEVTTGQCINTFTGHEDRIASVAFSPEGQTIVSGSWDLAVKLWEVATTRCSATLIGHDDRIASVAFSPNGRTVVSGSWDHTTKLWEVATMLCLGTFAGQGNKVNSVAFSRNGLMIVSSSDDHTVKLWDTVTRQCLTTFVGHGQWVASSAFSPDGKTVVSGSWDDTVKVWDVATGQCLTTLLGHEDGVRSVAFSSDGRIIISSSYDRTIKLWHVASGQCLVTLTGHENWVASAAFSPDGLRVVSGADDCTVKLWELKTEKCVTSRHEDRINSVSFSPDGNSIILGSGASILFHEKLNFSDIAGSIKDTAGMFFAGCSCKNLHQKSFLSDEAKKVMSQYGVIFDEQEQQRFMKS